MRTGITFEVTAADRTRLEAIAADRNSPQKHVWRANIILLTAAACGTAENMRREDNLKQKVFDFSDAEMRNLRKSAATAGLSVTDFLRQVLSEAGC